MKNSIKFFVLAAALLCAGSCHEPDELEPSTSKQGINSISAQFATGEFKTDTQAKFTTMITDPAQERIVINIPYYYPEATTQTTEITQMRVTANLDDNCKITPALGTLDLTKENWFTLTRADGTKMKYCVTGQIKKSNKCAIEEFKLPALNLVGIINEDKHEISIVAVGALAPATAAYRLSYHASISPDPAAAEIDYNSDVVFTVTAHDGTSTQKYTVKKTVPPKVPTGIRTGSQKLLWAKTLYANLGISTVNMTGGMAVTDKYILLNTRNANSIVIDRQTGAKLREYDLPASCKGGLVNFYNTADAAGNILLCNLSPNAGSFKIWKIAADLQSAPELWLEWAGGKAMGRKISVCGSIDGNAIITAPIHTNGGQFARWQVVGGVLTNKTPDIITIAGTNAWSNNNVDIIYTDPTNVSSDYFAAYYGGGNIIGRFNGQTNTLISKVTDVISANYVANSVDFVRFNNYDYMAFTSFNGFTWGGGGNPPSTDCCWMLDASGGVPFSGNPSAQPLCIMQSAEYRSRSVSNGGVANGNTTGDIAFYSSPDGYMLYMYMMITNGHLVAWQFDCIDNE
ncbi:MAG: DUF5018 domain-containing protein [Alistipes sp.]